MNSPDRTEQTDTPNSDDTGSEVTITLPPRTAEGPNDGLVAVPPSVLPDPKTAETKPTPSDLPTTPGTAIPSSAATWRPVSGP